MLIGPIHIKINQKWVIEQTEMSRNPLNPAFWL